MTYLLKNDMQIDYIIDSNETLHGTNYSGIPIVGFETVKDQCDVIVVAIQNVNTFEKIREQIKCCNIETDIMYFEEIF